MTVPITVVIPVGPAPHHRAYLYECLDSVRAQTVQPAEILVIDNGTGLRDALLMPEDVPEWPGVRLWTAPWAMGLATGFNAGVGLATTEHVFFLGSDDLLRPRCLELCWRAWTLDPHSLGWYFVGVRDSSGYEQNTPCLAAMVTKTLWKAAGGLELGSDYGSNSHGIATSSCEIAFISKMILADGRLGATYRVSDEVLYFWRRRNVVPA
jgi:glycosyltransferase involved in cell wall biosynthesis